MKKTKLQEPEILSNADKWKSMPQRMLQRMSTSHEINRTTVALLKRTINPATGKAFNYREIGEILNMSAQGAHFYAGNISGRCPECLRKLKKLKNNKKTK